MFSFKTQAGEKRNINKARFLTTFELALYPYIENVIVDADFIFEYVSAFDYF